MNTRSSTGNADTCFVERSKVREILIGSDADNESTRAVLQEIDALPIFTAGDFLTPAQTDQLTRQPDLYDGDRYSNVDIAKRMWETFNVCGDRWFKYAAQRLERSNVPAQLTRPRAFLSWAVEMFGSVAKLRSERLLRFVEEAIELAHAEGMEREVFNKVADRVYSRPAGNVGKEIGQAQACLETFAENIGLSSEAEAQREWKRVQEIPREEWTRRHSAKQALGIALPSTSRGTPAASEGRSNG